MCNTLNNTIYALHVYHTCDTHVAHLVMVCILIWRIMQLLYKVNLYHEVIHKNNNNSIWHQILKQRTLDEAFLGGYTNTVYLRNNTYY